MKGLFVLGNAGLDISLAVPRLPKPGTLPDIAIDAAQRVAALTVQRPGAYLSLPTTAKLRVL